MSNNQRLNNLDKVETMVTSGSELSTKTISIPTNKVQDPGGVACVFLTRVYGKEI